jgi:hypothetical protein
VLEQVALERRPLAGGEALPCSLGEDEDSVRLRAARAADTALLHARVDPDAILDRRRGDVVAAGRLERLLGVARDLEPAVGVLPAQTPS